ncbi:unnamed protein product [Brassicogethes aeneus]|uniref:Chitin-binding type-2 domain-containing protein n=1 Tax=Brassicogethes aeneus TaxID=1431903 RepID=A0A9P0AYK2_BRAAE|nr:unnamed protein product [Brassicogethes aeneus]
MGKFCCILFLYLIGYATCFTITPSDTNIILPTQTINQRNPRSFIRTFENKTEVIQCREGTKFDLKTMVCVFDEKNVRKLSTLLKPNLHNTLYCPESKNTFDSYFYADDCKSFLLCGPSESLLVKCAGNLLFNPTMGFCDYPLEAGCCESDAQNSDVFWVQ